MSEEGDDDNLLKRMAINMKTKFDKYWGSLDTMNKLLIIAVVLDPRYKMEYVSFCYGNLYAPNLVKSMQEGIKELLFSMYDFYRAQYCILSVNVPLSNLKVEDNDLDVRNKRMKYDTEEAFKRQKAKLQPIIGKSEVEIYFLEQSEDSHNLHFDILGWWRNNCTKYPILSLIAKDLLAIPISTVASESAFSTGGRILDPFRSSLTPKMVEALICTQNWLQSSIRDRELHVSIDASDIQDLELYESIQSGKYI